MWLLTLQGVLSINLIRGNIEADEFPGEDRSDCGSSGSGRRIGLLVLWYLCRAYNSYQKEQEEIVEEVEVAAAAPKEKLIDIRVELAKLKLEINTANPSLEDIKRIFTLLTSYLKQKTVALSNMFKQNRRKLFPKESRFDRLPEYMRHSFEGIMQLQNAVMQLQNEQGQLLGSIGLTQAKLAQFGPQLAPFMQELILNSDISLD